MAHLTSRLPTTVLQVNAIIALIILGGLTWRIAEIIRANDLETHEIQILGGALIAGMGGVVYVARMFASQPEVPTEGNDGKPAKSGYCGVCGRHDAPPQPEKPTYPSGLSPP